MLIAELPIFLSDSQWLLIQPLLSSPVSRGRPSLDPRLILEAIFWKLTSRQPWYDIPTASPSWQTCYQHFHRWQRSGLWKSILISLLTDLRDRGDFNLPALWESGRLSLGRDASNQIVLNCPLEFNATWQQSTALLLLLVFSHGLLPRGKVSCR